MSAIVRHRHQRNQEEAGRCRVQEEWAITPNVIKKIEEGFRYKLYEHMDEERTVLARSH